jgi:hypothetical protein
MGLFDDLLGESGSKQSEATPAIATTFGYNDPEDNGVGAWGDVTNRPDVHGVSLPISVLRQQFGNENKAHGQLVRVTNPDNGQSIVAPIIDKGPSESLRDRIDLTHATNQAIGGSGKTPVNYEFVNTPQKGGLFDDLLEESKQPTQASSQDQPKSSGLFDDLLGGSEKTSPTIALPQATPQQLADAGAQGYPSPAPNQTSKQINDFSTPLSQRQQPPPKPSQLTSGLSAGIEGTVGLLSGLGAVAGGEALGIPVTGGASLLAVPALFTAGSALGVVGAKRAEKLLGLEPEIQASQQEYPKTAFAGQMIPQLPFAAESALGYGATALTKGAGAVAGQMAGQAAIGAGIMEPMRYGVDVSLNKMGITDQPAAPITLGSTGEQVLTALALGGKATGLAPSKDPIVNEKTAKIFAGAESQTATPPEQPKPINIPAATPEELAKVGEAPITPEVPAPEDKTQKIADLSIEQLEHEPESDRYKEIQQQIDELQKPAEAPVAEAQHTIKWDNKDGIGSVPDNQDIDYFGFVKPMSAEEFKSIAAPTALREESISGIKKKIESGEGVGSPFLEAKWDNDAKVWRVSGHEGRHRTEAVSQINPNETIPVHIFTKGGMRGKDVTEEMKNAPFIPEKGGEPIKIKLTEEPKNAVQEQTTREVGVRNAPTVGEGVGGQNETEVPATQGEEKPKEEVGPEAAATTQVQAKEEPLKEEKITPEPTLDQMAKHDLAYVDPQSLKLSEDVPNFKEGADPITGVVAGEELKGKYDPEAAGIVHIWERLNGDREVISGRHRWQLALANKVPEILIKIHREADGFTKEDALVKDAQLNIKDEKGSVKDFAAYFRNDPITKEDAQQGGLLSRSKQKNGFSIGRYSEDDLYGLFRAGKISEAKAAAIAESAPNDAALQRAAIGASKGLTAEELPGYIALLKEKSKGSEEQTNLFGEDESFIKEAMRISKAASARANELSEQIRAVQGAAKNPEAAAKLGVDVKDPQGLQKRIADLKEQREKYAKFWLHDDIKEELGIKKPALPTIETTGEGNLFGEKEMPFSLAGETEAAPPETEPRREDTLTGSFDFGEPSSQGLETWADNTIKESRRRLNVGLDPEVLSAYAIKGAFKIARGVRDFTAWSKEMLSEFGEAIRPHLEDLWSRANQLHNEEQATKYGPKPPSEREVYAKRVEEQLSKVYGRNPTAEEVGKYVDKKFPKAEAPAPVATPAAGGEGEKISIRTKDQEDQQRRGILTSVVAAGEGMSKQEIIDQGNANLKNGADPYQALEMAKQGDRNALITAKAYSQALAKRVSDALKKYGPASKEYKDLAKQYQDYYEGIREAATTASDILRTFQGETDLSDAADIAREYTKITGEEPSLSKHDQIKKVADKVNKTVEESNQAQQEHRNTMDSGLADVDVKTPQSLDESRQQVADLSDQSGAKQKAEIDRLNQENEKIKADLEEIKQAQGQTAEELKAYYEAKIKDLENQQAPQYGKEVLEQARKIVNRWKADAEEAGKSLRKKLRYQGAFPDVTIINDVARILRGYIGEFGLNLAESTVRLVKEYGPEVEQYAKEGYAKAKELIANEHGGEKAVKAVKIARAPKPKAKTVEKIGEEKVAENLRKRIAQYQKKIDDINSGKISTPKDVEKITNEEIKGLEADLANKKQELSNARLKAKQADLFEKGKVGEKLNPEQVKTLWETAKRFYLDKGESDYDKMINDMASDLGLLPDQIRQAFSSPKGAKKASDEMYLKQRNRQMALDEAKRWLDNQKASWIGKTFGALAEKTFKLAIFGHGTAFIGTHAPTAIYTHPRAAFKAWLKGFSYSFTKNGKIKNIVDNKDLIYRTNWITARRAGLENDPREIRREGATKERGDSVMAKALNAISGGRGFDALFHLRQDMFDQAWDKLSVTQRTPEMAEMLAGSINNATGFTKGGKGTAGILQSPITKVLFFAPKLIASRFKWLIQDPARMLGTFTKMVNPLTKVTPEERMSAIYEAKNKAKFLAYLGGTLLANQALLSVTGSNQNINFTDPKKNDWLAYKGLGYQFATIGAFTRISRLIAQEYHAVFGDLNRFEKAQGGREQAMKNALYGYFRSGFSPIVRDMVVAATGKDYVGNVVPWSKEEPDRGRRRLTWGEVVQEQFAPIPISEASTQKEFVPAFAKAASAAFTGGRLETPADIADYEKSLKPKEKAKSKHSNRP